MPEILTEKQVAFKEKWNVVPSLDMVNLLDYARVQAAETFMTAHVNSSHLLLGAMSVPWLGTSLAELGLDINQLGASILSLNPPMNLPDVVNPQEIGFTSVAKRIIEAGIEQRRLMSMEQLEPEHIVLGMIQIDDNPAIALLEAKEISLDLLRQQVIRARNTRNYELARNTPIEALNQSAVDLQSIEKLLRRTDLTVAQRADIHQSLHELLSRYSDNPDHR